MPTITDDRKMKDLIDRVGKDVSQLRSDIRSLFMHTWRHTLPHSAREIREQARERLHAGGGFAASQFRYIRQHPGQSSVGLLGGLLILGAVGAGIHFLCKSDCCGKPRARDGYFYEQNQDSDLA
jgi:hypothetical protein